MNHGSVWLFFLHRLVVKEHVRTLRWHRVPVKFRRLWFRLINRGDPGFKITSTTTVCSNHFVLGQPMGEHLHPELYLKGYSEATSNFEVQQVLLRYNPADRSSKAMSHGLQQRSFGTRLENEPTSSLFVNSTMDCEDKEIVGLRMVEDDNGEPTLTRMDTEDAGLSALNRMFDNDVVCELAVGESDGVNGNLTTIEDNVLNDSTIRSSDESHDDIPIIDQLHAVHSDHLYVNSDFLCSCSKCDKCVDNLKILCDENIRLRKMNECLISENEILKSEGHSLKVKSKQLISSDELRNCPNKVKLYTGLDSYQLFEWLFNQIKGKIPFMHYY
jgi:hypothetical protein